MNIPSSNIKEAIKMSKGNLSEVYILCDGSNYIVSNISDIQVEYYEVIAEYLDGKLTWVDPKYK